MRKENAASAVMIVMATVLVERTGHGAAFLSRGCMSSGVPLGLEAQHRVVLVGDQLSWDSADYKLSAAVELLPTVEEVLFVQVDEVDDDLLALQLRSFDPDTVLVSVRTRAFERLPWTVLQIARSECRRGDNLVVLVLQLQAHAIPTYDRAFARVGTWRADGSHEVDTFESRADGQVREVLRLYVDDVGPLDAVDLLAGGLHMEWFGPSVPERWCSELQACDQRPCAGHDALHDIIVLVSAGDCGVWSGGKGGEGDGFEGDGGCTEARYIESRFRGRQVLVLHAVNTSAARAHLMRARGGKTVEDRVHGEDLTATRELLTSAKVLVMAESAGAAVQHAVECMALGGPALVMSAHIAASAGVDDIINATNALVYRTGDLEGLGLLLDQLLSDAHMEEEPGVEGHGGGHGREGPGKLRHEMALALLHAEEEALALRTQLEKRLDAANAQVAAALVDVAGLKQELAALQLEYSKYKMRYEAREAELQAQIDQLLQHVAALERDKTALQTEVNAAKDALLKAGMLERQLRMEVSNAESLVQQKTGHGREGAGGGSGRVWRCELQQRACEDACLRHGMVNKVVLMCC
jgi:hypothetical protein